MCWFLRGLERWYVDMIENLDFCEALLDKVLVYWIDCYSGFLKEVEDLADVVMIGDDLVIRAGRLYS